MNSMKLTLSLCLTLLTYKAALSYDQAFLDHVANSNLNTFEVIESSGQDSFIPFEKQTLWDHIYALLTPRKFECASLNDRDKREIVFTQTPSKPLAHDPIIDSSFVNKMELVHAETRPEDHLARRFISPFISTEFGKKRCIELLSQPLCDLPELKRRQTIIRELVTDDTLRVKCDFLLKKIAEAESLLFDLYQLEDISEKDKFFYFGPLFDKLGANKSPKMLTIGDRISQAGTVLFGMTFLAECYAIGGILAFATNAQNKAAFAAKTGTAITAAASPLFIVITSAQKQLINLLKNLQQKMIGVATYTQQTQKLFKLIATNQTIKESIPDFKSIATTLSGYSSTSSDDFNALNLLLKKSTFNPGEPSFFSSPGNTLAAYRFMAKKELRAEFAQAFNLLGELDLFVGIAKKMREQEKLPVHYTFAEFSEEKTPYLKAENFWNPFINPQHAITNSIEFKSDAMRDMILSGPNTGGKSTLLKALMINALLAQTFGIAAADTLIMTPFTKLNCHMNITDDTAGGVSLFKAEINRAQELMTMIRTLKPYERAFIIIDEIFTGTSPEKAEELSYKFVEQLNNYPNVLFIDATHFKKLTDIEKETNGSCKNYHMGAQVNSDGSVTKYTYTLEEGPSPINNAAQIAQEEGIFN